MVVSKCAWFKCTIARRCIQLTLRFMKLWNPWEWSMQDVSFDYRYRMYCDLSHKRVVDADVRCVEGADEIPPSYLRTYHGWCKQADWSTETVQRWVQIAQPKLRQFFGGKYHLISHKRVVDADVRCVEGADEIPSTYLWTYHGWCKQADWSTETVQRWVQGAQPMLRQLFSGKYHLILLLGAFMTWHSP